jgi:hypothetical protein
LNGYGCFGKINITKLLGKEVKKCLNDISLVKKRRNPDSIQLLDLVEAKLEKKEQ